jgi:hypothetical protein
MELFLMYDEMYWSLYLACSKMLVGVAKEQYDFIKSMKTNLRSLKTCTL